MIQLTKFDITSVDDSELTKTFAGSACSAASLTDLVSTVTTTAWSPSVFKQGRRANANFLHTDLVVLDVDDKMTLPEALTAFRGHAHIIYTTRNHQKQKGDKPACDRFRVVLRTSSRILSQDEFRLTMSRLLARYPQADQLSDPARMFFRAQSSGSVVSVRDQGELIEVVSRLGRKTREFLTEGAPAGEWNRRLYASAKDMQQQGYEQEQAEQALEQPARLPGNIGTLDEKDLQTIESAYSKPAKYPPRTLDDGEEEQDIDLPRIACAIFQDDFLLHVDNDLTTMYKVMSADKREVIRIANEDVMIRHVVSEIQSGEITQLTRTAPSRLLAMWKQYGESLPEAPKAFKWPDEPGWAIKTLSFMPEQGETGAWDEFTCRLTDPEAFMAYTWSCFEYKNKSRQALWLHGERGQDGKSTVTRVIADCFGGASASINNTHISTSSRFTLANFYNKRVAIYADAKNVNFPMSELFRNMTSGDIVPIEFKNEGVINVPLYVKILISSNERPALTMSHADRSRIIMLDVAPSLSPDDPMWEANLVKQLPAFLFECRKKYAERCPNHGQIKVNELATEAVEESAESFQEGYESVFFRLFEVDEESEITCLETYEELRKSLTDFQISDFKKYLRQVHNVRRIYSRAGKRRVAIYKGIKLKHKSHFLGKMI